MRETIEVKVPDSWKDVTLRKYLELQKDLENHKDDEMAQFHFTVYHLCGIDVDMINKMTKESSDKIKRSLNNLIQNQDLPIQNIIDIDGIAYGFEPNLSKIAYGAYIDITKYDTIALDNNWAKIMSILYRPIVDKRGDKYSIATYNGDIDDELFLDVSMDVHLGCFFFCIRLYKDLMNVILNFSNLNLPHNTKLILEKSGKDIQRLLNSQEEMFKKWKV